MFFSQKKKNYFNKVFGIWEYQILYSNTQIWYLRIPNTPEIKPLERISHCTPKLETLVLTYFAHARQNTYVSDVAWSN